MRRLVAVICAAISLLILIGPAGAADEGKLDEIKKVDQADGGDVVLTVGSDGTVTQPSGGGGGTLSCTIHANAPSFETPAGDDGPLSSDQLVEGSYYWLTCEDADGEVVVTRFFEYSPGEIISAEELARRARDQLAIRYPEPRTSPSLTIDQIVGLDTWLWIDEAAWSPISATASIPGLSVSATATPQVVRWVMGDGTVVECDGPGTPYDDEVPGEQQSTDCSHLYQGAGAYTASATITWSVRWEASDGSGGELADVQRTTQFPLTVIERQAVGR